jgi:hypothetical protein
MVNIKSWIGLHCLGFTALLHALSLVVSVPGEVNTHDSQAESRFHARLAKSKEREKSFIPAG